MKTNMIGRIILSICLLLFIYVAAACSVDKNKSDKKSSNDELEEVRLSNARMSAFADKASSYIKYAEEEYVIHLMEDYEEVDCFTIAELNSIYGKILDNAKGIVKKGDNETWIIYLTDGTYVIDGKTPPFNKNIVTKGSKLSKTSC